MQLGLHWQNSLFWETTPNLRPFCAAFWEVFQERDHCILQNTVPATNTILTFPKALFSENTILAKIAIIFIIKYLMPLHAQSSGHAAMMSFASCSQERKCCNLLQSYIHGGMQGKYCAKIMGLLRKQPSRAYMTITHLLLRYNQLEKRCIWII